MKPHLIYLFTIALGFMLPACTLIDGTDDEPGVYEGVYSQGFEDSPFEPCERSEQWLIVPGDSGAMRIFRDRSRIEEADAVLSPEDQLPAMQLGRWAVEAI